MQLSNIRNVLLLVYNTVRLSGDVKLHQDPSSILRLTGIEVSFLIMMDLIFASGNIMAMVANQSERSTSRRIAKQLQLYIASYIEDLSVVMKKLPSRKQILIARS